MTRLLGWLGGFTPTFWLAVCGVLIASLPLSYCKGRTDGRAALLAEQDKQVTGERRVADESEGEAAVERETDRTTIEQAQKDRDDAITAQDDTRPSASRNALNCERLRRQGTDIDKLPACGGRAPGR